MVEVKKRGDEFVFSDHLLGKSDLYTLKMLLIYIYIYIFF